MKLTIDENYTPGHVPEYYGNGYTELATLKPEHPKDGDFCATLTVNGKWGFSLIRGDRRDRFYEPEQIRRSVEKILANYSDGDMVTYQGERVLLNRPENNWFEVFVDVFDAATSVWMEYSYSLAEEFDHAPRKRELRHCLAAAIKAAQEEKKGTS